jgi:hypothetical protein
MDAAEISFLVAGVCLILSRILRHWEKGEDK